MIYNRNATFPYPVLTNNTEDYVDSCFLLDIELNENTNNYIFSARVLLTNTYCKMLMY